MPPDFKAGARCCSTQARNSGPLIGPSTVSGARNPSVRSALRNYETSPLKVAPLYRDRPEARYTADGTALKLARSKVRHLPNASLVSRVASAQWHSLWPQSSRHTPCAVRISPVTAHGMCLLLTKVSAIRRQPPDFKWLSPGADAAPLRKNDSTLTARSLTPENHALRSIAAVGDSTNECGSGNSSTREALTLRIVYCGLRFTFRCSRPRYSPMIPSDSN